LHEKKLTIFVGNLGSGKTEIALNFALFLVKQGYPTTIVDLDIINPYFRTRMVRHVLEHMGLKVVCPRGELANADLPSLSPAIQSVLEDSFD
jgi:Mrp family chromosome partitioning ATPase